MDPEFVREILQIVNEVSEPVYVAARQKVLLTNIIACLGLFPGLVAAIWLTIYARKKERADKSAHGSDWLWGVVVGAFTTICIYISIVCVIANLLTANYRTYYAIRMLLF